MYVILMDMGNNFKQAVELIDKSFSINDFIEILNGEDDNLKAIAILNLENIPNQAAADLLVFHLTNHNGQIRELVAYKINELSPTYKKYFQSEKILTDIVLAINDVNPNVVRYIISSLEYIENKKLIFDNLISKINQLNIDIINKPRRGKVEEHVFTKKAFKIYWSLEAIKKIILLEPNIIFDNSELNNDLYKLVVELSDFEEYTVREKIAQIVNSINNDKLKEIKEKLKNDENYFVKNNRE